MMTSSKAKRVGQSRNQDHAKRRRDAVSIGPVERLENRELLSTFQPVHEKFQWTVRGKAVVHEIQFDGEGNCLGVKNPQVQGSNDCSLGQFGTPPNRVVVTFNAPINKKSFNALSDVAITGDVDASDPFRITGGAVSKRTLLLFTRGDFADGNDLDVTMTLQGIQGKRTALMDPWSETFQVNGATGGGGGTIPDPVNPPPVVQSVSPAPGATLTQATTFVEALFSEDLDPTTVNSGSVLLTRSGGDGIFGNGNDRPISAISISYSANSDIVRFTASEPLVNDTYEFRLTSAIRDMGGAALDGDRNGQAGGIFTSSFRVQVTPRTPWTPPPVGPGDITPPFVSAVQPGIDQVLPLAPSSVVATFSEPLDPLSVTAANFRLIASGDGIFGNANDRFVHVQSVSYHPFLRQATLHLAETLTEDTFRIELVGSDTGIKDLAGLFLDGDRDGKQGGTYRSEFRVDLTPPAMALELAGASDSGAINDNRTSAVPTLSISGVVQDGTLERLAGYRIDVDSNADGKFDNGSGVTDIRGAFSVTAPGLRTSGRHTVYVRATDLAGNTTVQPMTVEVDAAGPLFSPFLEANQPTSAPIPTLSIFEQAPTELRIDVNEPLRLGGVAELRNYTLRQADSRGLYMSPQSRDMSSFIQAATFDNVTNDIVLTLQPGLPHGSYRLAVHRNGTITDTAGNRPIEDGMVSFTVGPIPRQRTDLGPTPLTLNTVNRIPSMKITPISGVDSFGTHWEDQLVQRTTRVVSPTARINVSELELPNGPDSNNVQLNNTAEPLIQGGINFGVDSGEDSDVVITGRLFNPGDVDYYSFRAKPGEIVSFQMFDPFGFGLFLSTLSIIDLGTDNVVGGIGDAADRTLVTNACLFAGNCGFFFGGTFIETSITGITGRAMDAPHDEVLNPLGSERRLSGDRTYLLAVGTFAGIGVPGDYVVTGTMRESFTRDTNLQQIIYVDWDGATNIPNAFSGLSQFVNVPAFDVRDYGMDPIFQDTFIDATMKAMREDLERIRAQSLNPGFTYELRDSLHYPDPGNAANVTRVIMGGTDSLIGFSGFAFGIADSVDTGNQVGNNNVLVFTKTIADFRLGGQLPLGFGPAQIPILAQDLADFVATHELGHVLGGWHTRDEFRLVPDPSFPGFFFFQQLPIDNIMDAVGIPELDKNIGNRFDHYVCFSEDLIFGDGDGILEPGEEFFLTQNGRDDCFGVEFFEGVADSIGVFAWGMEGVDAFGPRVLEMDVSPGQIKLTFSEGVDVNTLITNRTPAQTIFLERAGGDNDFDNSDIFIELLPVGTRGATVGQADSCLGNIPVGISLYDTCFATLTLSVKDNGAPGLTDDLPDDIYRLTLSGSAAQGIRDSRGTLLDGEINLPANRRISPRRDRFPSGDGSPGGSFQFDFLVASRIRVDGDFPTDTSIGAGACQSTGTGTPGLIGRPFNCVQRALESSQFASLREEPVTITVAAALRPYVAVDPRLDPTPLTTADQGNFIIPDRVRLEFDGTLDLASVIFVASPAPDNPATPVDESSTLRGTIHLVDSLSPAGGSARVLGSFPAPIPVLPSTGLAFDGSLLYLSRDTGSTAFQDSVFVLDPFTIDPLTGSARVLNTFAVPTSPAGGQDIDGLAVSKTVVFASDSLRNTVIRLDKSSGLIDRSFTVPFDLVGGVDYDPATDTLWASGLSAGGATQIHQINPRTGAIIASFGVPLGVTTVSGIGLANGEVFFADRATGRIYNLDPFAPANSPSFSAPAINPSGLAGVPINQIVVKLLGTRIEAAGQGSSLVARGESLDNPVIFTSVRDTTVLGIGANAAAPADWMGIAFRADSDDFGSLLENVVVRYAGGPGMLTPTLTQTLSPITLFDARPTLRNVTISNNAEAAVQATLDSFERLLARSGPELSWDVETGVPIPGDWDPTRPGTEFGVYQSSTGRIFVDANGNRALERTEDTNCDGVLDPREDRDRDNVLDTNDHGCFFADPGQTPVVGNFSAAHAGDEIAVFDRATGLWTIDMNRDFVISVAVPGQPDDVIALPFGQHGDIPVVGDWGGTGVDKIGVFRPRPSLSDSQCLEAARLGMSCFILDLNGNLQIDFGEEFLYGEKGDVPLVGDFAPAFAGDEFGTYRPSTGEFRLDRNANRIFDPAERDSNGNLQEDPDEAIGTPNGILDINDGPIAFGPIGGKPIVANWCTDDPLTMVVECPGDEIGVVDSSLKWLVDSNGSLKQDANEVPAVFGMAGDQAVPGDWATGAGQEGAEFGLFREIEGLWFVDADGDMVLDPSEDKDFDGRLDVNEDVNGNSQLDLGEDLDDDGRLDIREDLDPDGVGPMLPNGILDLNDGGFKFAASRRNDINEFVFKNSLNAVWVKPGFQTVADAHWDDVQIPHVLTGTIEIQSLPQLGVVPTLELEPGLVVKMGLANLSIGGFGSTLLIDSDLEIGEPRVTLTSLLDDARGPRGRRHDTNNDLGAIAPLPGDWGGIVVNSGATAIINGAELQYAGNLRVPAVITDQVGVRRSALITPNPITLNQSNCGFQFNSITFTFTTVCPPIFATITNNIIANTNSVQNISNPRTRPSDVAAIGIIGASVLGEGPNLPRVPFNSNPFIRGNDVGTNNGLNGLEIRTSEFQDPVTDPLTFANAFLFTESRWDDTDITYILLGTLQFVSDAITFPQPFDVPDVNIPLTFNGFNLTLASNPVGAFDEFDGTRNGPAESLVVKFGGRYSQRNSLASPFQGTTIVNSVFGASIPRGAAINVGFDDGNAGTPFQNFQFDTGGDSSIVIQGVPGNPELGIGDKPVVLSSIRDDSIGPQDTQEDTNNDSTTTTPARGDWEGIVVGAWARNFGRISPINSKPLGPSLVNNAEIRYANTALMLQSQSIEVTSNLFRDNTIAIDARQGPTVANNPMGLNPQGVPRDPAQPLVMNNVLARNGLGLQLTGGPDSNNLLQESYPSRAVIIHNTFDINDAGMVIQQRSGPLIMNNAITGTTGTALSIDNSSLRLNLAPPEAALLHDPVQVVRNLFFGNGNDGQTGTVPATVGGQEIIGVAPGYTSPGAPDFNYKPTPGSPLVDSALSEYGDRSQTFDSFTFVQAPDRDKLGVFRRDHPGTPNVGVGSRPWLDIGALELVDVVSAFPRVINMNPVPNATFLNGFGPALVELEFSEPVSNVNTTTFVVEASGGDRGFTEGNEVRLSGQVSAIAGSGGTRWIFVPASASNFNSFQNEIFRVTALGTGSNPINAVASGNTLDGEFFGALPSGDGVEGGDYRATFTIGDVLTGTIRYVDDTSPPCAGVPRTDPNLQLFNSIQAALAVSAAGDTILVCPGVYTAPLTLTVPVTIESLEGALPRKDALGQLIPNTGTFISVTSGAAAITVNNVSGLTKPRIGSTRGGVNHGFVITTSPISGPVGSPPAGVGIDVIGTAVEIEGNVIISNTIGVRADSAGTSRMPNIVNNIIVGNTGTGLGGGGGAGIDITSRTKEALATVINNTISYNQAGILLREDGQDPLGRVIATVQNNNITSNTLTGLSTVSALATPNVFHNNAWGNAGQTSNFGGTLTNITPSAFELAGNPIPDRVCTLTTTVCGNISVNPLFINPVDPRSVSDRADFYRLSNFELQSVSKLIDRGMDKGSPARDFKGRTRTIDIPGVGNNTSPPPPPASDSEPRSVDIGALEFVAGSVAGSVGQRSTGGTARAMTFVMDDVLDQLGDRVAGSETNWKKRAKVLIDDWLDEDWDD